MDQHGDDSGTVHSVGHREPHVFHLIRDGLTEARQLENCRASCYGCADAAFVSDHVR